MKKKGQFKVTIARYPFILERYGTSIAQLHHIVFPRLTVTCTAESDDSCLQVEIDDECDFDTVNTILRQALDFMKEVNANPSAGATGSKEPD